jgi:hypothetical protein
MPKKFPLTHLHFANFLFSDTLIKRFLTDVPRRIQSNCHQATVDQPAAAYAPKGHVKQGFPSDMVSAQIQLVALVDFQQQRFDSVTAGWIDRLKLCQERPALVQIQTHQVLRLITIKDGQTIKTIAFCWRMTEPATHRVADVFLMRGVRSFIQNH